GHAVGRAAVAVAVAVLPDGATRADGRAAAVDVGLALVLDAVVARRHGDLCSLRLADAADGDDAGTRDLKIEVPGGCHARERVLEGVGVRKLRVAVWRQLLETHDEGNVLDRHARGVDLVRARRVAVEREGEHRARGRRRLQRLLLDGVQAGDVGRAGGEGSG